MKRPQKSRTAWHAAGVFVVAVWLAAVGTLVHSVHFSGAGEGSAPISSPRPMQGPEREWKEIYLEERKVGYSVSLIRPAPEGYFIQEETFLKMTLMGLASGIRTRVQCGVDTDFRLKSFRFRMLSGAVSFEASGSLEGDSLLVETGAGDEGRTHRIPVEEAPVLGAGMGYYFRNADLEVGRVFRFPVFDPSTMSRSRAEIRVVERERVEIKGISYDSFRMETELWGNRLSFWLDQEGRTLKETGFLGLTAVRSSAAVAPEGIQGSGDLDFYEVSAVSPDRTIPDPRRVKYLKVKLEGIEGLGKDREAWGGGRQRLDGAFLEITREEVSPGPAGEPDLETGETAPHLKAEFNIESDHPEIRRRAERIAGGARDPLEAARAVMEWVNENLDKRPVVSVPSALEVLRTGIGDCNEHAVLTTALLRALGIPSRIAVGLVYTRGKFFYHAWTEAFVGEWVSMDATLKQMPVDATHIKFLHGNLDRQVELAGLIGRLQLKVVDYAHDSSG